MPTTLLPTEPFLLTIPTRPSDHTHVPEGWTALQIGRDADDGVHPGRLGLVCYDPLAHNIATWLSTCTLTDAMIAHGWQRVGAVGATTVWFRPLDIEPDVATTHAAA